MFEFGLFSTIIKIFIKILKPIFKLLKFIGAYWILLNAITWSSPIIIADIVFYISIILILLTTLQNLYRVIKREPQFSIFRFIIIKIRGNNAAGFVAKLKLDTVSNISGVVFGKTKGKYVTQKEHEDGHVMTIGGAGSGKSSCFAIPTLMSWKGRVFAIDIKGELYKYTSEARDKEYIKVFNPSNENAFGYNPFYLLEIASNKSDEAKGISQAIVPLPTDTKDPHWITSAQNYLTGAILYFEAKGENFSQTMYNVQYMTGRNLINEIMESENDEAKLFISKFSDMDDKELGSILSTLSNHILPFATDSDLQRALDGTGNCITPYDLENGFDIYINIEEHKLKKWKGLLTLIVNQFCNAFEQRKDGNDKPILFLLDEFARLGKIECMIDGLATLRSKKIHIAIITQSLAQLDYIYGKVARQVILDNCNYQVILKAKDTETQEYFSKSIGTFDKSKQSISVNSDMFGIGKGTGTSNTTEEKRIIKPEEFAFLQDVICLFPTGYARLEKTSIYNKKDIFYNMFSEKLKSEIK